MLFRSRFKVFKANLAMDRMRLPLVVLGWRIPRSKHIFKLWMQLGVSGRGRKHIQTLLVAELVDKNHVQSFALETTWPECC